MAKKKQLQTVTVADNKQEALASALEKIEKQFGKNAVVRMNQDIKTDERAISTGSIGLDKALGIGGLPRGRIVEIYGPESSGKTTLALHAIASTQAKGGIAAFIDAEHALDPKYAEALGVDINSLLVSQPDSGDQGLEIAEQLIRSGAIDIIVIDSVAALVPRAEIEGEMGDATVGLHARLMSQAMRKMAGSVSKSECVAVFINQLREKVGGYGSSEVTTGGRALKFYASVRIDIRRIETIIVDKRSIGSRTRARVVKNKMAPPFRETCFDVIYGQGISQTGEIVDMGCEMGLIQKSGAWYVFTDHTRVQGRDAAKAFLSEHTDIAEQLKEQIMQGRISQQVMDDDEDEEYFSGIDDDEPPAF